MLTQYLGWRATFLVNLPIIAVLLLFIQRVIPDDRSTGRQRIDVLGVVLVTASAAALIYGLSNGQQQGFGSLGTVLALGLAVLLALAFVLVERTTTPIVSFSYFSSATHRAAVGVMLLMGAVLAAYIYFTSLYMHLVLGESALLTGLSLIPSTATVILVSTFATRRLLERLSVKRLLLIGLTLMGIGQVWLSFMTVLVANSIATLRIQRFHAQGEHKF